METSAATPSSGVPRREFIRKTATAAAAVAATSLFKTSVYGQSQAPSANVTGANNRIAVGIVGVGFGIGQNHLTGIHKAAGENNTVIAGACDVFNKRRSLAKANTDLKDADLYVDYRKLLERKDIDAVLIATHDPLHSQISLAALDAGKHVYCEKPLTRYLDEAFTVYEKVKSKPGLVFQVGSQGCSADGWHKCAEIIKSGKLGTLVWGQGYYCRNNAGGEWNYDIDPESTAENIDWERWLGPVKKRAPFSAEHFHRWRKYYAYCSGLLGDLAPHRLHPLMLASGNPEFPIRVSCVATKNVFSDKEKPAPEREVPEHVQFLAEFPSGYMVTVTCSTVNEKSPGFAIYGHKATMNIGSSGERIELIPEKQFSEEIDPETITGLQPEDIRVHEKNWFDCIRSGKQPNANIELAIRVQTVISLAEMSDRLKVTCLFDETTRKITAAGKEIAPLTYGTLAQS
jgi:predicted dehydrogenase